MKNNEFQCAMCGNIYINSWTDEEAEKECIENFGEEMAVKDNCAMICDDCYQKIKPSGHPQELREATEEWNRMKEKMIQNLIKLSKAITPPTISDLAE